MPSWEPPYPTPHWRLRKFFSTPTTWEPPRPVVVHGHTYALTDEARAHFPSAGVHLIPRETPQDLVVPAFTGYEDPREAEKWITGFCEWTIMNGMSQGLCQELLLHYLKRALRPIPHHPLHKVHIICESWEDLLRDFFMDMKIKLSLLEPFKRWYWLKRLDVPIIWFSHTELKVATDYFSSKRIVGESNTSRLIKGLMPNLDQPVVVKKLKKVIAGSQQKVLNEINLHRNLTKNNHGDVCRLLGYSTCAEDPLLVYEYVPNGNLREHMKERYGEAHLWVSAPRRLSILIDIASGVAELHYNSKFPVCHRNLKPSNILLDDDYRAKVSGFGEAIVIKSESDRQRHPISGSLGYLCPVFRATGRFDDKSDVWSLGVIMLELASGLKAWDPYRQREYGMNPFLVGLMIDRIRTGTAEELLRPGEPYDVGTPFKMEGTAIVVELVRVALWCCCPELARRPRANEVVAALLQIQSLWVKPGQRAIQQTTAGGLMPTLQGLKEEMPLGDGRPPQRDMPVFLMRLPGGARKLEFRPKPKDPPPKPQENLPQKDDTKAKALPGGTEQPKSVNTEDRGQPATELNTKKPKATPPVGTQTSMTPTKSLAGNVPAKT